MNIGGWLGIPGIPVARIPNGSEQLHPATAGGGEAVGEADGAHLAGEGGEREPEKGLDVVLAVFAGDLHCVGGREGCVWIVFLDHEADCRAEDLGSAENQVWQCQTGDHGGEGGDGSDESKLHGW